MKTNIRLESLQYCYVYSKYKIEEINCKKYIMPEKNATKKTISITEHIDDLLVETLNIGKKEFFREPIHEFELLNYYAKYGSFGFMIDLAINKFFILDDRVAVRDAFYINKKGNVDFINTDFKCKSFRA